MVSRNMHYTLVGVSLLVISTFFLLQTSQPAFKFYVINWSEKGQLITSSSRSCNLVIIEFSGYKTELADMTSYGKSDGGNMLLRANRDFNIDVEHVIKHPGMYVVRDDSPLLIDQIRSKFVEPKGTERNLSALWRDWATNGQVGQVPTLVEYFKGKKNGVFIEAGAYDGETWSNTLLLEMDYNWTGLMVEANPNNYELVVSKNRNGKVIKSCISKTSYPQEVMMDAGPWGGKIGEAPEAAEDTRTRMQCYPVRSLMLAAGYSRVDLFSLDIEGDEYEVLKNIPWDLVDIQALLVEVYWTDHVAARALMKSKGYRIEKVFGDNQDILWVKDTPSHNP